MSIRRGTNDPARFEGNGISYRAKLIGIEPVNEARGDKMCQDAITKLKNSVKISKEHKQKIFVNVTLEGLTIIDAISLIVLHQHAVHKISFIARDTSDSRAFGYIYGDGNGSHQFFAIKTASAAEQLVLSLRDLFQVVYDMKKKEMEEAKKKLNSGEEAGENNNQDVKEVTEKTEVAETKIADTDGIYHVPPNNAPAKDSKEDQVANLLDLEDQAEHILKGIEQIKNLDFDSADNEVSSPPAPLTNPMAKLAPPTAVAPPPDADPWAPTPSAPGGPATSGLGDLAGLQTNATTTPFSLPSAGFGAQLAGPAVMGLPVTSDPFGSDPFSAQRNMPGTPHPGLTATAQPGFAPNPFGTPRLNQQFAAGAAPAMPSGFAMGMPVAGGPPMSPPGMFPGIVPHGMVGASSNPFASQPGGNAFGSADANLMTPIRNDQGQDAVETEKPKPRASREDLFGDLLDIKKSTKGAVSPKDMFGQINSSEKKTLNEIKAANNEVPGIPQQVGDSSDPFGGSDSVHADTCDLVSSAAGHPEDPFNTSHLNPPLMKHKSDTTPPPVPSRSVPNDLYKLKNTDSKTVKPKISNRTAESIVNINEDVQFKSTPVCEKSFMLPSPEEPPPPLPSHIHLVSSSHSQFPPTPPPRPEQHKSSHSPNTKSSLTSQNHTQTTDNLTDRTIKDSNKQTSDPFSVSLKLSSSATKSKRLPNVKSASSLSTNDSKSSSANDPFSNAGNISGDDPFGLPLKLTPGFKAVAKFGNDPFEDSFYGNTDSSWDAFGSSDTATSGDSQFVEGNSPFGDAFAPAPATQTVNGNSSGGGGGLLD